MKLGSVEGDEWLKASSHPQVNYTLSFFLATKIIVSIYSLY